MRCGVAMLLWAGCAAAVPDAETFSETRGTAPASDTPSEVAAGETSSEMRGRAPGAETSSEVAAGETPSEVAPGERSAEPAAQVRSDRAPAPAEPAARAAPVETLHADLDGDGAPERIEVRWSIEGRPGALLVEGVEVIQHTVERVRGEARVVDLDRRDGTREVVLVELEDDDGVGYVVVAWVGGRPVVSERFFSQGRATFSGDGRVRLSSENCGQKRGRLFRFRGHRLWLVRERVTGRFDPDRCYACPFVYVEVAGRWRRAGEILRRQVGAPALDVLPLGHHGPGPLRVRIAERELERSFVDSVALRVGDRRVPPAACGLLCEADGRAVVLEPDEHVDLLFEVPEAGVVTLESVGYYVPLAARTLR